LLGGEGIMIFLLFFIPAAVFFAIYEIQLRRLQRKLEESAFAGLLDDD
jgi:hypothetical protein